MKPYYQDESITIYHGDCLAVLPELPKAGLTLTDPPYEAEAHTKLRRNLGRKDFNGRRDIQGAALDFGQITPELRTDASRLIAQGTLGWALVFCQAEAVGLWKDSLCGGGGAVWKRAMVWIKPDGMPQFTGDRPGMGYESIAAAWCGPGKSRWNGGGKHGVFTVPKHDAFSGHGGAANDHPTQKPLKLMLKLVDLFSQPGDLVLDPFMGSGTTLRAAKDLGRRAIGIEQNEKYCEVAVRRMRQEVLL